MGNSYVKLDIGFDVSYNQRKKFGVMDVIISNFMYEEVCL